MKKPLIPILAILTTLCASAAKPNIKTPNIDCMAKEGRRFTSFMVASPVCTPSRAALLTGSYPKRVGMHKHVLFPASDYGLNPEEYTLADHFRSLGYATAAIGKWHLGLAENTYVIFTSDNGPWLPFKNHGGSASSPGREWHYLRGRPARPLRDVGTGPHPCWNHQRCAHLHHSPPPDPRRPHRPHEGT